MILFVFSELLHTDCSQALLHSLESAVFCVCVWLQVTRLALLEEKQRVIDSQQQELSDLGVVTPHSRVCQDGWARPLHSSSLH